MTTPSHTEERSLLLAEYVLGVLDRDARARVTQEVQENAALAAELALWQARLMPLAEDVPPVPPPSELWSRIQAELGFDARRTSAASRRSTGLWENVLFWRWLSLGASAGFAVVAIGFVAILVAARSDESGGTTGINAWLASLHAARPPVFATTTAQGYQFASLAQASGTVSWTVTVDAAQSRMIVVPSATGVIAADRSAELWLVPTGGKPIALGLLTTNHPVIVLLSDTVMQSFSGPAALAVSLEPVGGSPSGQPTGPIVAQGGIRGT